MKRTLLAIVTALSTSIVVAATPPIAISVGPDEPLTPPSGMPSLPDEHTTIFPPAPGSSVYRLYAATRLTTAGASGNSGTVALESTDLTTFVPASGYPPQ